METETTNNSFMKSKVGMLTLVIGAIVVIGLGIAAEHYFSRSTYERGSQTGEENMATTSDTVSGTGFFFACKKGQTIEASFTGGSTTPGSVTILLSDGRSMTLPQTISASGARYVNADESFVFWNKGDTAFVEEKGVTTYEGCGVVGR